jgi:hypothetical protein
MRRDIRNVLKSRKQDDVCFTTLIDLYDLPGDFPGKAGRERNPRDPTPYVEALEEAFRLDIDDFRFIPHLQLYEYETLLFADPEAFRYSFDDCDAAIEELKSIARQFPSIEHINDGETTAPSKRIISLIPAYEGRKSTAGPDTAVYIGLAMIRAKCSHFNAWLSRLERLWIEL